MGLATFFDRRSEGGAERARQRHIGEVSLLFSGDGGLRPPSLWRTGAALCEAPAVPVAPAAKYQPKDPAEPVSDPPAVVSNDDPSRLSGGMKQEEEGSVSPGDEQL